MAGRMNLASSVLLLGLAIAGPVRAQSFNDYLNKKYEIQKQQADTARANAETERMRAETEARAVAAQSNQGSNTSPVAYGATGHVLARSDDFAGKSVPKYRLQNGVTLQASGGFRPSDETRCTSDCFVPLKPY